MDRSFDRGRGARSGERASLPEVEKKASKPTPRIRLEAPPKPVRVKIVWEVCSGTGKVVQTFPYFEKAAAEARTRALTRSTRRAHVLRATKVPME